MTKKLNSIQRSLEERVKLVQQINDYRKAHPKILLADVLKSVAPDVSESNYYTWNKRRELAEATGELDGKRHAKVEHFPLAIIPEKSQKGRPPKPRARDDDKDLAAMLLEVAAKLLRR